MADIVLSLDLKQLSILVIGTSISIGTLVLAIGKWMSKRTASAIDSYTTEKMRNLATHEDISIAVQDITSKEWAKADVAGQVWNTQQMWMSKRDAYVEIITLLADMKNAIVVQRSAIVAIRSGEINDVEAAVTLQEAFKSADRRLVDVSAKLSTASTTGVLFISTRAFRALSELEMQAIDWKMPTWAEKVRQSLNSLDEVMEQFVIESKRDLGYSRGETEK
jgi:hypothetical protein